METLNHLNGSPIIEETITVLSVDKDFSPQGDQKYTIQFMGDSGQWVYAFPLKNIILQTKEQAIKTINKMEEVSVMIGFEGTRYRLVELIFKKQ